MKHDIASNLNLLASHAGLLEREIRRLREGDFTCEPCRTNVLDELQRLRELSDRLITKCEERLR